MRHGRDLETADSAVAELECHKGRALSLAVEVNLNVTADATLLERPA